MPYFLFFYSFLFSIVVLSFSQSMHSKDQRILSILLLSFLLLTFCFSYQHGVDWLAYYNDYYDLVNYPFEIGYKSLVSIVSFFALDFWVFSALIKVFMIVSLYVMLKRLSVPYIPVVIVFFIMVNYHLLTNVLRQDIAMGIIFIAIPFLFSNRILFFILVALSSTFHLSAVAILGLFFILKFERLRLLVLYTIPVLFFLALLKYSLLSFALNMIESLNFYPYLINKLVTYFSQSALPITFGFFIRLILFILVAFIFHRVILKRRWEHSDNLFNITKLSYIAFMGLIFIELLFFQTRTVVIRLGLYYSIFIPISLLCLLVYLKSYQRVMLKILIIGYILSNTIFMVKTPFFLDYYLDYNNYFSHIVDPNTFEERKVTEKVNKFWDSYVPP